MKRILTVSTLACVLSLAGLRADVVELRNGNVLNGTFKGGTATSVSFEVYGSVMQLPLADIVTIKIDAASHAAAVPSAPPAPAASATAGRAVTVPAGTLLLVRMDGTISTKTVKAGANFSAKLEYDLIADGAIVARAGTKFQGKVQSATQARRARGKSTLDLRLVQIVPSGSPVPIVTSGYQEAGENSIKKVAKAAAVGAVIGNNTGDGDAGEGAAVGAAVSLLKPGEPVVVQAGTLIEFTLTAPVTLPALP